MPPAVPMDVVVFMSSDHALSAIGAYGGTIGKSPNIDRLAASGMTFTRAYCNAPVGPVSRQSFFTGLPPHANGASLFHSTLSPTEITLAHALRGQGYRTAVSGRMRFSLTDDYGLGQRVEEADRDNFLARKGFEPVDPSLPGQPLEWKPFDDPVAVWLNAANVPFPAHKADISEYYFAGRAAEMILKPSEEPRLVFACIRQPNTPFVYPVEYRGRYAAAAFAASATDPADPAETPKIMASLTPEEIAGIIAGYATTMEFVDECVGVALDAVEKSGRADRTIVVFLSDVGYMLGERGRFEKHCLYDPAVRVPLIVRWPGRAAPGSTSDALVELIDVFATLAEIAGVNTAQAPQARSLVPILKGEREEVRDLVFSEYLENEEAMVRDRRFKLIYSSGRAERNDGMAPAEKPAGRDVRLYDLQADPGEATNVAAEPARQERVQRMKRQMLARLTQDRDEMNGFPESATLDDRLDAALVPPESWAGIEAEYRKVLDRR